MEFATTEFPGVTESRQMIQSATISLHTPLSLQSKEKGRLTYSTYSHYTLGHHQKRTTALYQSHLCCFVYCSAQGKKTKTKWQFPYWKISLDIHIYSQRVSFQFFFFTPSHYFLTIIYRPNHH